MKKYNTPHRRRVIKTRLTEEEYAEFSERVTLCKMSQAEFIRQALTKSRMCTEYQLFPYVPLVHCRRAAAGRKTGSCPFAPGRQETLYRVRRVFSPQIQPREILPGLRRKSAPPERSRASAEKIPPFYAFRL